VLSYQAEHYICRGSLCSELWIEVAENAVCMAIAMLIENQFEPATKSQNECRDKYLKVRILEVSVMSSVANACRYIGDFPSFASDPTWVEVFESQHICAFR
jgi:hypothetical protein